MQLTLLADDALLPSCSTESGGAMTVAMNITGFASPCATDSNSAEMLRSHMGERVWEGGLFLGADARGNSLSFESSIGGVKLC